MMIGIYLYIFINSYLVAVLYFLKMERYIRTYCIGEYVCESIN